ncbi:MAG TPA: hypothetical protein VKU38_02525 [Ktedonobacteraceae bacterium]|nr:hypothetical protein [Ktedonobacteraceae bacterium]
MPTAEERLTTLEFDFDQFKAETTTYYQEMALQVTMSKGLTEDAVKRLMQLRVQVDQRFNSVDQQLTGVKQDIAGVKLDIKDHTTRLDRIEALLAQILERLP